MLEPILVLADVPQQLIADLAEDAIVLHAHHVLLVAEENFGAGVTVDAFGHGFLPEEHRASVLRRLCRSLEVLASSYHMPDDPKECG
jgi:hypothetical protein